MSRYIGHPSLQRLHQIWQEEIKERSRCASLGTLTARDIEFFRDVFRDGFVAHGQRDGVFRLTFVGTELEAHLGRNLISSPFGLGLPHKAAVAIEKAFGEIAKSGCALLIRALMTGPGGADPLEVEVLCLPLAEASSGRAEGGADEGSILGLFAATGMGALAAEPARPKLEIVSMTMLGPPPAFTPSETA
jgi:hypothetical protein